MLSSEFRILEEFRFLEILIDIFLLTDIVANCFTAYEVDRELITDLRQVFKHYLSTWFLVDVIAVIPGLITIELYWQIYFLKLLRYIQIRRVFEQLHFVVSKIRSISAMVTTKVEEDILKFFKCLFFLFLIIHICACIWIYIGIQTSNGWVNRDQEFNDFHNDYFVAYPTSLYFIALTFT